MMHKAVISDRTGNEIRLSRVSQFEGKASFGAFSAKYVVQGSEWYQIDGRRYEVRQGEYITGNTTSEAYIQIDHPKPVSGICIDIDTGKLRDIIGYEYGNHEAFRSFFFGEEGMVNRYRAHQTHLGRLIRGMEARFEELASGERLLNGDIFYAIGECIVRDYAQLFSQFSNLKSQKNETSRRLFDFVTDARHFIDHHFMEDIGIARIASEAKLSEYHFIRLFKKVWNVTPYQYVLNCRLEFAYQLLYNGTPASEVAYRVGFSDKCAFSKAFRNKYGMPPSAIRNF